MGWKAADLDRNRHYLRQVRTGHQVDGPALATWVENGIVRQDRGRVGRAEQSTLAIR